MDTPDVDFRRHIEMGRGKKDRDQLAILLPVVSTVIPFSASSRKEYIRVHATYYVHPKTLR
jgi:hypothetical protein